MAFPQLELRGLVSGAQKTGKTGKRQDFQGLLGVLLGRAKLSESHNRRVIKSFWAPGKLGFASRFLIAPHNPEELSP